LKYWDGWDGDVETQTAVEETFNLKHWDSRETSRSKSNSISNSNPSDKRTRTKG
jgi:hypothetical protein